MFPYIALSHDVRLSTWGVMVFIASVAVLVLGRKNLPIRGLPAELIERTWPWLFLGGFLGAHLYYLIIVDGWPVHHLPFKTIGNILSGTAVQGGILGGIAAAAIYMRWENRPFLPFCDAFSPAGALAQAIARVGCFAAGCCYGRPTDLFIGVSPHGVPLHPTQLYESVLDLCLAVFLQKQLRASEKPGGVFTSYLMGASLIRFGVQFFRDDDSGHLLFGLAHSHFLSLAMFVAAVGMHHQREVRT